MKNSNPVSVFPVQKPLPAIAHQILLFFSPTESSPFFSFLLPLVSRSVKKKRGKCMTSPSHEPSPREVEALIVSCKAVVAFSVLRKPL
jgi:hypothetical protein